MITRGRGTRFANFSLIDRLLPHVRRGRKADGDVIASGLGSRSGQLRTCALFSRLVAVAMSVTDPLIIKII